MKRSLFLEIITILFMILFMYTALSKITDYTLFKEQLAESKVLAPVANIIAVILPLTELIVVIMLFIHKWQQLGLYLSLALMITFTIYVVLLISFSKTLPCSCGGVFAQLSWQQHVIFNISFTCLAIWGIILKSKLNKISTTKNLFKR